MTPTIGRIVHYTLTAKDAEQINKRRQDAVKSEIARQNSGAQVHWGRGAHENDILPMIATTAYEGFIGGQVFLSGNDTLWVDGVYEGTKPGTWRWPPRV